MPENKNAESQKNSYHHFICHYQPVFQSEKSFGEEETEQVTQQTIYRWPLIGAVEEPSNDDDRVETDTPPSPDSKVEQVTKDLCKWMKNLVRL